MLGDDVVLKVVVRQEEDPATKLGAGITGSQPPLPPFAFGSHQLSALPPFRLHTVTVSEAKVLPEDTLTTK
jgi:hypothetical protein